MSGPIVRKYGFPNFEQIFGERNLEHGVEGSEAKPAQGETPSGTSKPAESDETAKKEKKA
ncbi:hypothetical protein [Singulisphaera sp. PoT]|uniref:hypothetical protein n=1 Tax=Singulisphaera sp. PoT TaxID=3411797 RepID=UPI003BF4816E